ncbi:MAG TPA: ATPase, T2SS/T4P/T4SS family [Anaerovoracaceae bacterium]|nr:ATPase, T2SS/T4P/T4SS family [Anaerovoracaceae bacterium]
MNKIITVFGKSGSGKSTLAANLGSCLAKRDKVVVLISANLQHGGIQLFFNQVIKADKGIFNALNDVAEQEHTYLTQCQNVNDNLYLLAVPNSHNDFFGTEKIEVGRVDDMVRRLSTSCDHIIFDCTDSLTNPITAMALYLADTALVTYNPSYESIFWHKSMKSLFEQLRLTERIIPVVSTYNMGCKQTVFFSETEMTYAVTLPGVESAKYYESSGTPMYYSPEKNKYIKEYKSGIDRIADEIAALDVPNHSAAEYPEGYAEIDNLIYLKNLKNKEEDTDEFDNYEQIKDIVMRTINTRHSGELAEVVGKPEGEARLQSLIRKYLNSLDLVMEGQNINDLTSRIYDDMAGLGILSKYIYNEELEELNINSSNNIWATFPSGKVRLNEKFGSDVECQAIIKKALAMGKVIIDGRNPIGDSSIGSGKRISGAVEPCVRSGYGGIASIRKQKTGYVTRELLISSNTASEDEVVFIETCLNNDISMIFSGATGSGKTASMGCILKSIPKETRIGVIQDNDEIDVNIYDGYGTPVNDAYHLFVKDKPYPVTEKDLTKVMLRLDPDIVVLAEMRGDEAADVVRGSLTGHTALSSVHATSSELTYKRIVRLCHIAEPGLSEQSHLEDIIRAFPIIVFSKKLKDGSRKWMQVYEATGVKDGKVDGELIFKFVQDKVDKEGDRIVKIHGTHKQVNPISDALAETLRENCVDEELIRKWRMEDVG